MIGVDEVGRGAWAGPLLVCAARLNKPILGLNDSKKLTKTKREYLNNLIQLSADVGYGWVSAKEIDTHGLSAALKLATERAIRLINPNDQEDIIIDGNINFLPDIPKVSAKIKADVSVPAVSAASIAAKVARDNYMSKLNGHYAKWQFARHVGYGTALHIDLLAKYGPSDLHRLTYKPLRGLV